MLPEGSFHQNWLSPGHLLCIVIWVRTASAVLVIAKEIIVSNSLSVVFSITGLWLLSCYESHWRCSVGVNDRQTVRSFFCRDQKRLCVYFIIKLDLILG